MKKLVILLFLVVITIISSVFVTALYDSIHDACSTQVICQDYEVCQIRYAGGSPGIAEECENLYDQCGDLWVNCYDALIGELENDPSCKEDAFPGWDQPCLSYTFVDFFYKTNGDAIPFTSYVLNSFCEAYASYDGLRVSCCLGHECPEADKKPYFPHIHIELKVDGAELKSNSIDIEEYIKPVEIDNVEYRVITEYDKKFVCDIQIFNLELEELESISINGKPNSKHECIQEGQDIICQDKMELLGLQRGMSFNCQANVKLDGIDPTIWISSEQLHVAEYVFNFFNLDATFIEMKAEAKKQFDIFYQRTIPPSLDNKKYKLIFRDISWSSRIGPGIKDAKSFSSFLKRLKNTKTGKEKFKFNEQKDRMIGYTTRRVSDALLGMPYVVFSSFDGEEEYSLMHEMGHTYGLCDEYTYSGKLTQQQKAQIDASAYKESVKEKLKKAGYGYLSSNILLSLPMYVVENLGGGYGCLNPYPKCCRDYRPPNDPFGPPIPLDNANNCFIQQPCQINENPPIFIHELPNADGHNACAGSIIGEPNKIAGNSQITSRSAMGSLVSGGKSVWRNALIGCMNNHKSLEYELKQDVEDAGVGIPHNRLVLQ